MNKIITCSSGSIRKVRVVHDFLSPPADLAPRVAGVKVTIALSRHSVNFFKREARRHS
jgi:hypothetical protein